jgi:ABC-type branched-subunit amino acid transport system permease subunit
MTDRQLSVRGGNRLTKPAIYAGLVVILAILPLLLVGSPYLLHVFILTFIYIIATVSLRVMFFSGQASLAHASFMGLGAFTSAVLSKELGWSPWVCIPIGALVATGIGALIAYIFSRVRALLFSMLTLFFGMAILYVIATFSKWTGGYVGIMNIPSLFGVSKVPYYYFFLGLTVVSLLALYRFEFSRIGINLKTINQSHLVASSVGINEIKMRVLAVTVGSFFVGLVGAGYAHYNLVLAGSNFGLLQNIYLIIYVVVGGMGSFAGPIIGVAVLVIIPEVLRGLQEYSPFILAGLLLIIVYLMPEGLVGLPQLIKSLFKRLKGKGGSTSVS